MEQEQRWTAGVIPYAQMGYYAPDYVPADTDLHRHLDGGVDRPAHRL